MKTVSPGLAAHLAGTALTLATLWRIVRRDAQVFTFTDHDQDVVYGGETYVAARGYQRAAISSGGDLAVDETEVLGLLNDDSIAPSDIRAGLWDFAEVRMFAVNWADPAQGALRLRRGWLGEVVALDDGTFRAELRGLAQPLQQTIGELYQPECRADLGDRRCGVPVAPPAWAALTDYVARTPQHRASVVRAVIADPAAGHVYDEQGVIFECTTAGTSGSTVPAWDPTPGSTTADGSAVWTCRAAWARPGTIEAVTDSVTLVLLADGIEAFGDAYFTGGVAIWETGANAGVAREIIAWEQSSRTLRLFSPPPILPAAGDVLRIQPGCDKLEGTCKATFANFLNFRGEPDVPGAMAILERPA